MKQSFHICGKKYEYSGNSQLYEKSHKDNGCVWNNGTYNKIPLNGTIWLKYDVIAMTSFYGFQIIGLIYAHIHGPT